jgi:dTDP-glucose 4,6-dehydratase
MKLLVTGGCGFIGSNFIETCLKNKKNLKIVNVDTLLTGSNRKNFKNTY